MGTFFSLLIVKSIFEFQEDSFSIFKMSSYFAISLFLFCSYVLDLKFDAFKL